MQVLWPSPDWFAALPAGPIYRTNEPLAEWTTIRVGGPAQVWAEFADWLQLQDFMQKKPIDVPLTLVGKGSNLVVRDGGLPGVVAHIGKGFDCVEVNGLEIYAEAGAACGTVARAAREQGLAGIEFFGGIPGSVGGALRMNAGAYGRETFDQIERVWLVDDKGQVHEKDKDFVVPRYRGTQLPEGWIYKAAQWRLQEGNKESIRLKMREINHARSSSQPLHLPSSGSWFKNVIVDTQNIEKVSKFINDVAVGQVVNAWRVVDAAGCRGWREGGAQVSEMHCNFFVNVGGATARDLDVLSTRVEMQILEKLGLVMAREVRFMGVEVAG
jgi:UDP-N-acetylmuramate dehydrogenase